MRLFNKPTSYHDLRDEALRYAEQFGYPVSPDAVSGKMNKRGQGDARDAFRHIYGSAVTSYELGSFNANLIGDLVEIGGGNTDFLRDMDTANNELGVAIGKEVNELFADNKTVTKAQIKDEIAKRTHEAIQSGKARFYVTRDYDHDYTPPSGVFDPINDHEGNGFIGSIFSSIGSLFSRNNSQPNNFVAGEWGGEISSGPLWPSTRELGQMIQRKRQQTMEDALLNVILGRTTSGRSPDFNPAAGRGGFPQSFDSVPQMLGGIFENVLGAALNRQRTRTTTSESARSSEVQNSFRLSRSQQAAQLAEMVAMGQRNL